MHLRHTVPATLSMMEGRSAVGRVEADWRAATWCTHGWLWCLCYAHLQPSLHRPTLDGGSVWHDGDTPGVQPVWLAEVINAD